MIIPNRVIVAGEAFYKSGQETVSFKFLGMFKVYPEAKLNFLVPSKKLFKFYIHYEYTEPFRTINKFGLFSPEFMLFLTTEVKNPSFQSFVVGSSLP